jgi:hypothetical protein
MWPKVTAKTAAEICGTYKLSADAEKLLRAEATPLQFAESLVQAGLYLDAFAFLAHGLPKREAIWWACLSVRHILGPELPPKERVPLKAAVEWVLEPDEAKRRTAQAAGEVADSAALAGKAALAVYASGGSLIAANLPVVPPPATMTARYVLGCLTLASVRGNPGTFPVVQRELVDLGIAIAQGKVVWPSGGKKS